MQSPSLAHNDIQRERFASKFTIGLLMSAVTIVLVLFFPKSDILGDIFQQPNPSIVTVEYLSNLLVIYPNDTKLRLLLVKEYIYLNEIGKAELELKHIPYLTDRNMRWRQEWLQYLLHRAKVWSMPL